MRAPVRVEMATQETDGRAGRRRATEQRECGRWRAGRLITDIDPMPAARRAQVLTQELPGRRIHQADMQRIPLHVEPMADPARRGPIESRFHLHTAIEMDRALAKLVIAKRLDGQRTQGRSFLGKHGGDLALRGAMDAGVGPVRVPAIQIGLRGVDRLEALSVQRRLLRVADAGFDFALAIRIADPKSNMRQWVVVDANRKTTDILWSPPALIAQKEEPT